MAIGILLREAKGAELSITDHDLNLGLIDDALYWHGESITSHGADATGTEDSTDAIAAAAAAVVGTATPLIIPVGTFKFTTLDLRRIRNIVCYGRLVCTQAGVGEAIKLGTSDNANGDMVGGRIRLRVEHSLASNETLEGSVGVRVYGSAHCEYSIHALYFDIGIQIKPENSSNLYAAFNGFQRCRTYGCATGLDVCTTGSANGWINENDFEKCSFNPAANALTSNAGLVLRADGGSAPNDNKFRDIHLESWTTPIKVSAGLFNVIEWPRLESAGPIILGTGAVSSVGGNMIISSYPQIGTVYPSATMQAPFVNWVLPSQGAEWTVVRTVTIEDWNQSGPSCAKLFNTVSENSNFSAATFSGAAWKINSNHRGALWVSVRQGDVVAIDLAVVSGTSYMTLRAQDIDKADLSNIEEGDLPYVGSMNTNSISDGTSGTGSAPGTITSTNYPLWQFVSINRSEVKFLKIEILSGVEVESLTVRKLCQTVSGSATPKLVEPALAP